MPLSRSCTVAAFESNIAVEMDAGKSRDQAVAIARVVLRESCLREGKPLPKRVEKVAGGFTFSRSL